MLKNVSQHDEELSSHDSLSGDKLQEAKNDNAAYSNGFSSNGNV